MLDTRVRQVSAKGRVKPELMKRSDGERNNTSEKSCYIFDALRGTWMNISREMSNSECKSSSPLRNRHEMCIKVNNNISAHISFRYCSNVSLISEDGSCPSVRDLVRRSSTLEMNMNLSARLPVSLAACRRVRQDYPWPHIFVKMKKYLLTLLSEWSVLCVCGSNAQESTCQSIT